MSNDWMRDVINFNRKFGVKVLDKPGIPDRETALMRIHLVDEEKEELDESFAEDDLVGISDAITDLIYVLIGMADAYGIDLRPIWDIVHESNMAKEGGGKRPDGKILKPEGWKPPDIASEIERQSK